MQARRKARKKIGKPRLPGQAEKMAPKKKSDQDAAAKDGLVKAEEDAKMEVAAEPKQEEMKKEIAN